jgi:hypothetical protein
MRKLMVRKRIRLRGLVDDGVRRVLGEEHDVAAFRLCDARFNGPTGFAAGQSQADIERAIRELNEPDFPR